MNPARVAVVSRDELLGMRIGAVLRDSDYSGATQARSITDLEVGATEVLVAQLAALAIPPRRTLTSLRRRHGPICVVVIIPHSQPTDVARLLTAGVDGTVDEAEPRSITHPDDRCRTVRAGCCPADEATPRRLGGSAASAGADPQSSGSWSHERRDRSQAVGLREHRQEPSLGAVHKAGGSLTVRGRHHAQRADGMGFRPRTRRKPRTPQRKIC